LARINGSVSTLALLFTAAFATRDTWKTFLVGLAASLVCPDPALDPIRHSPAFQQLLAEYGDAKPTP
jgi:hypothetical protein